MTVHFVSQIEVTLEKYIEWCNNPIGKKARKKLRTTKFIGIFGILFTLVGCGICAYLKYYDFATIYAFFTFAFTYKLFYGRIKANKRRYDTVIGGMTGSKWIRTITFGSNVQLADNNSTITYKYSDFKKFDETDKYYLLYQSENYVLRVDKGSFITGAEEDFKSFITSRIKNRI